MELENKFTQIIFAVNVLIALTSLVLLRELPDPMDRCGLVDRESCKKLFTTITSGKGFVAGKPSSELIRVRPEIIIRKKHHIARIQLYRNYETEK